MPSRHRVTLAPVPCPACEQPGEMVKRGFETLLGMSDPPHDPNCVEGLFECTEGHRFHAATQYQCSCGWSGVRECKISGHNRRVLVTSTP